MGATIDTSAISVILPPSESSMLPVTATVEQPFWLANSKPLMTLGDVPEPLYATTRSPLEMKVESWPTNTLL